MGNNERYIVFDMMKGIGILLMMLCHLKFKEGMIHQIIYSFHMPLFFLLAGYFAKNMFSWAEFRKFSKNNAERLLLPYYVTGAIILLWYAFMSLWKHDASYAIRYFLSVVTATIDGWESSWGVIYVGPIWFLFALFLVREIFGLIQLGFTNIISKYKDEIILTLCLFCSVASVLIHPYLPSLPLCIAQTFTAIAFYAVGWYIHNHPLSWWLYSLCMLVWPLSIMYGGVDISLCKVNYYPLSFIGACGGTYALYLCCNGIDKLLSYVIHDISYIPSPLAWCGMYSLPILCMHNVDMYVGVVRRIIRSISGNYDGLWGGDCYFVNCNSNSYT